MLSSLVSYLFGGESTKLNEDASVQLTVSPAGRDSEWIVIDKVEGKVSKENIVAKVDDTTPYRLSSARRRGVKRTQQAQPSSPVKNLDIGSEEKTLQTLKQHQALILKATPKASYIAGGWNHKLSIPASQKGFARMDRCRNPRLGKGNMWRPVFQPIKSC